jgi:anti-anti-sigma regulatory factor
MYSVEFDRSKRLLVISAAGEVTKKEVEAVALRVREMMKEVTPGFRVLTDFRWLDRMEPAAATHLAEIMDALAETDVAAVVRVVPDPHKDIGLNILSQFHYGPNIKLTTFESLAEALSALMDEEI